MKNRIPGLLFLVCSVFVISWVSGKKVSTAADPITTLRMLGHRTLLSTGDRTGKVLPIELSGENEYLIRFENHWLLYPDSLVGITKEIFPYPIEIKVYECVSGTLVYSFSIKDEESTIPCIGRQYKRDCYYLKAKLISEEAVMSKAIVYIPIGLLFLGSFTFLFLSKPAKPIYASIENTDHAFSKVNEYCFNHNTLKLKYKNQEIALSSKEADLASLFFKSPNTLLERDYLMKTIWEDQGVFVGRSLDVFISKLRKKLTYDPDIKLVSVFGKGYKLEVMA